MRFLASVHRLVVASFAFLAIAATAVQAHDPYEISAETKTRADHLELVLTLARSTASYASGRDDAERRVFEPKDFESAKPRLLAAAPTFFVFRAGEEKLVPRTIEVALTIEDDVELRLTYPRPAPGKVVIKGEVFAMLPSEPYGSTFHFYGPKGELLAFKFINADDPLVAATMPGDAKATAPGVKDAVGDYAVLRTPRTAR